MTRVFALILATFVANSAAAEGCFPFCDTNTWKSARCVEICTVEFWDNATMDEVREVLDNSKLADAQDGHLWQPIHFAVTFGTAEQVIALLEAGANPDGHSQQTNKESPLLILLSPDFNEFRNVISSKDAQTRAFMEIRSQQIFGRNVGSYYYQFVVNEAEIRRITPIAAALISAGADVNIPGLQNRTAIMKSVGNDAMQVTKMLIEAGADLTVFDDIGNAAINYLSAPINDPEMLQILMNGGANIDAVDAWGNTALHDAVRRGSFRQYSTAKMLIAAGANINIVNNKGDTPLTYLLDSLVRRFANDIDRAIDKDRISVELAEFFLAAIADTSGLQNEMSRSEGSNETEAEFPLFRASMEMLLEQSERAKNCFIRTRKGTDVIEVQIPCPDE